MNGKFFLVLLLSTNLFAQSPSAPGGNKPTDPSQSPQAPQAPQTPYSAVDTGKGCPFEVDISKFMNKTTLDEIKNSAAQLMAAGSPKDCQAAGQNIADLMALMDPYQYNPLYIGKTAPDPTKPLPPGWKDPDTCQTKPALCATAMESLVNTVSNGNCSGSAAGIANIVATLGMQLTSTAQNPTAQGLGLVMVAGVAVWNIVEKNSGALGKANKLNKQDIADLKFNIEAKLACMANDTYYSTICRPMMYTKIIEGNVSKTRGGEPDKTQGDMNIKDDDLQKVYKCMLENKKSVESCMTGTRNKNGQQISREDFVSDLKAFNEDEITINRIVETRLPDLMKGAKNFHKKELEKLSGDYGVLRKKSSYSPYATGSKNSVLVKHCFYDYVPDHVDAKQPHFFSSNGAEINERLCGKMNSCLDKINQGRENKLKTLDIYKEGQKIANDVSACGGIMKLNELDELELKDALTKAEFDGDHCKPQTAEPQNNTNDGGKSSNQN